MAGAGAFHGAGRKAAGLSCGGGFLLIDPARPAALRCSMATVHAGPGAAALAVLSPAAAHPPPNLRILSSASARASAGVHTGPHRRRQSAQGKRRPRGSCNSRLRCRHVPPRTLRLGFACELPGARALPRPLNESKAF